MPMSNPQRPWWHIGVAGGIPLLALALGTTDAGARSLEREIGSGAAQKSAAARPAGSEPRKSAPVEARTPAARNHDPCCADEPPVPRARGGVPTTDARVAPATVPPQPSTRSVSPGSSPELRPGGARPVKRAINSKPAPPSRPGEQRRGGVGSLFGITFA